MILKNILVATDFSPASEEAVSQALELAERMDARVHVLHVYTLPGLPEGASLSSGAIDDAERSAKRRLEALAAAQQATGRLGELLVKMGDPADLIVRIAQEKRVDLIVLGTHGRPWFDRLLMGSVAKAVLKSAPCSVLVARRALSA